MAHALAAFIRQQMDERGLRNRDVVAASGLSRALVSKYATDSRENLARLPEKATIEALARAFSVSPEFLLGKAIEALGLGYTSGDFVNSVATASHRELLDEIERRLTERGDGNAGSPAPMNDGPDDRAPALGSTKPPDNVRELPAAARTVKGGSRTRRTRAEQDEVETGSQVRDDLDDLESP